MNNTKPGVTAVKSNHYRVLDKFTNTLKSLFLKLFMCVHTRAHVFTVFSFDSQCARTIASFTPLRDSLLLFL